MLELVQSVCPVLLSAFFFYGALRHEQGWFGRLLAGLAAIALLGLSYLMFNLRR
jgi:hypothetical protein